MSRQIFNPKNIIPNVVTPKRFLTLKYFLILKKLKKIVRVTLFVRLITCKVEVYRQLGDSNSQWHKKRLQKVPVGGQKFNPWTNGFFSNFVSGKNLTPFQP